jgi:cation transport regulator ChaC
MKVDFEYAEKIYGFVENFERKFWLLSDDHRGTPEK